MKATMTAQELDAMLAVVRRVGRRLVDDVDALEWTGVIRLTDKAGRDIEWLLTIKRQELASAEPEPQEEQHEQG